MVKIDILTPHFWSALISIIVIDLVLAGDNAIVIGLAAKNIPKENQNKVIIWGTIGAVVIRILATMAVVWLLKIPGLLVAGGLLLIWISIKLLAEGKNHQIEAKDNILAAITTIIVADVAMGLDNVLAIAGAAHDNMMLVVIGLLISVPIVVWGSTIFIKVIDKYPIAMYIGAAVLAYTSAKMIVDEKLLAAIFNTSYIKWTVEAAVVVLVLGIGHAMKKKHNWA